MVWKTHTADILKYTVSSDEDDVMFKTMFYFWYNIFLNDEWINIKSYKQIILYIEVQKIS